MMKLNSEFRLEAREALKNKWSISVLMTLVYIFIMYGLNMAISCGISAKLGPFIVFLLTIPMMWAYMVSFLEIKRGKLVEIGYIFSGYQDWKRLLPTYLLLFVYTTLWSLLLIVPGFIKSLSYAMTPFIMKDDPAISNNQAIEKSMAMMEGHKMQLFLLYLSFIGWAILTLLTFGIGLLWLYPYMNVSLAAFYENVKAESNNAQFA